MTIEELEALRLRRIEKYTKEIENIFNKAATEAASIGQLFSSTDLFSKPFSFSDYPITKDRIDKLMKSMSQSIEATVVNGITAEWKDSNYRNDLIAQSILGLNPDDEPNTGKFKKYFNNNNDALQAFLKRKDYGLNLSDRVWKYTEKFKSEIEMGLDTGIRAGLPASEMARDLKQYLQYPDKLFRRVRDQHGNLQLSKPAAAFHPGQGVYRSSYKNAMRLTRTETNMAYHAANHERHQQWDFIVGIEVRLTNNPGHVTDICDELKGKYPKTFKFTGWHPHCMCHTVTILKTQAEIDADVEKITNGEQTDGASRNAIKEMPGNFKSWAKANKERIATAKNMPYFIRDNFTGTDTSKWFIKPVEPAKVVVPKVEAKPAKPTPIEITKQRHTARTPEQRAAIQNAWDARKAKQIKAPEKYIMNDAEIERLKKAGWSSIDENQHIIHSWDKNMGAFNLRQLDEDITQICKKNGIKISERVIIARTDSVTIFWKDNKDRSSGNSFIVKRTFSRNRRDEKSVSHDLLLVPEKLQGNGITKELFQNLYREYNAGGFNKIRVHANINVGGYAWGKYGFQVGNWDAEDFINEYKKRLSSDDYKDAIKTVRDYNKQNLHEIGFPMRLLADKEYGKKLLLKSEWEGWIDLTNLNQRKTFEDYLYKTK